MASLSGAVRRTRASAAIGQTANRFLPLILVGLLALFILSNGAATILPTLQQGLVNGALYAIIGLGYSLTFLTTQTLNFAQGEFVLLGALLGFTFSEQNSTTSTFLPKFGLPLPIGIVLGIAVMVIFGILLERFAIRPFSRNESISWILSTVAVVLLIRNLAENLWSKDPLPISPFVGDTSTVLKIIPPLSKQDQQNTFYLGSLVFQPQEIIVLVVLAVVVVALDTFFRRTMLGKSLKAVALNKTAASLMGINVNFVTMFAFGLSAALAGIAGMIVTPVTNGASATTLAVLGIKAFAVAIIGGLDSMYGIVFAGLFYGILENATGSFNPGLRDIVPFVVLVLALALKPTGLFGRTTVQKV